MDKVGKFSSNYYKDTDLTPSCPDCSCEDTLTMEEKELSPPLHTSSSPEPSLEQQG